MSTEFWVGPRSEPDRIRLGPAVASGAEGVVYRGFLDLANGVVEVAVKMLQPGHLANLGEWTARWREQVELLEQVEVPGLVAVRGGFVGSLPHPLGHADVSTASLYMVMDWVQGVSLDRWARSVEVAEPEQLLMALVPVAVALDLLHSGAATAGSPVVHRDVKPANILIRPGGDTVLVDVGSVRGLIDEPGRSGVVGTPGYIAPEVRADARYSPAADRYSLGAVAFALLTSTEPPPEGNIEELGRRLSAAPLLRGRSELVNHVLAMLDPLPEQRPTCLANWVAQLRRSSLVALPGEVALAPRAPGRNPGHGALSNADGRSVRPRRLRTLVTAGAVLVALGTIGAVGASVTRQDEPERASSTEASLPSSTSSTAGATTVASGRRSSAPELDHITIEGVRIEIGEPLPQASQSLLRTKEGLEGLLSEDEKSDRVLLEFVGDPFVTIVVQDNLVNGIVIESESTYFDQPEFVAGASVSEVAALVPGLQEGNFYLRDSVLKAFGSGSIYFVREYDCNVEIPQATDIVYAIILVTSGNNESVPKIYGVQCPDRI